MKPLRNKFACATPLIAMAAALAGLAAPGARAELESSPVGLAVLLAPRPAAPGGEGIGTVDITLRFDDVVAAAGEPVLRIPLLVSNNDTAATNLTLLTASDARGPLALRPRDSSKGDPPASEPEDGGPAREWIADRAVAGRLAVRYSVPARAPMPPRGPAPPLAFSDDGAAVSGAGQIFLLLPPRPRRYAVTLDWDLRALPAGTRAISSFGEGRAASDAPLSAAELRSSFYMAGRIGTYPSRVPARGFFSAWQGRPTFEASALMRETARLHGFYRDFFGRPPTPYAVFLRHNPVNAGGGVGLYRSFVTTFGRNDGGIARIRITLAHEMFHTFQPLLGEPGGLESAWFDEGLAVFYAGRLSMRSGFVTPDAFLDDLNFAAARYYTSAMATVPNSEVPKRFWADTRIRTLPYDRGMLYFATVDEAVRRASHGKRSLDDLMLAMLALSAKGRVLGNADWEALLEAELGAGAVGDFHASLEGRQPLPSSGAFGPCFRRTSKPLRRFELGFDSAVLAEPRRIVRGLEPGSGAAAAGLRDGDEIVEPVPQDGIQGDQAARLELLIRRGDRTFPLSYLPRGETVDAWQWERVPGVPDAGCRI